MLPSRSLRAVSAGIAGLALLLSVPFAATAQTGPFDRGWTLQPSGSTLNFQSVKNETKVESSSFATISGTIDTNGTAKVIVNLESVDTKIDLRNVRMRFLFFESFQYPEATITAQLDATQLTDLATLRRKIIDLPYTMDLHGVTKTSSAQVVATYLTDDLVAISTSTPISIAAADFNLMGGITKLQEAAGVRIIPSASVTFDFLFARNAEGAATAAADTGQTTAPASAALEVAGNFDAEACKGRFEILSRSDGIYFPSGSAQLDSKSAPLLNNLADIINRCPGMKIEVGGHTDSDGSSAANQRLSEARAGSVTRYLSNKGISASRIPVVGYGEDRPAFTNSSAENKARNRRIEFTVLND